MTNYNNFFYKISILPEWINSSNDEAVNKFITEVSSVKLAT